MKAKISVILLALVALAFLAVAPAAADLTVVPAGGVVFVGEESLTLTTTAGVTTLEWFAAGDDPKLASLQQPIPYRVLEVKLLIPQRSRPAQVTGTKQAVLASLL